MYIIRCKPFNNFLIIADTKIIFKNNIDSSLAIIAYLKPRNISFHFEENNKAYNLRDNKQYPKRLDDAPKKLELLTYTSFPDLYRASEIDETISPKPVFGE